MSVSGVKTVVSTAGELFAGSSVLEGRLILVVRNMHDSVAIVVGSTLVGTKLHGYTIEPGEKEKLVFAEPTTVYAQSLGCAVPVEVTEA